MSKLSKILVCLFMLALCAPLFADDTVLIDQQRVNKSGGFPFTITQPGSYKLVGNLNVPAGVDGIDITANNVTLDLNGFSITGPIVCPGGNSCAPLPTTETAGVKALVLGTTIRNGHVSGFSRGIKLFTGVVDGIHATLNVLNGIEANNSVLIHNDASLNQGDGILAFDTAVLENTVMFNGGIGVELGGGGVFGGNVVNSGTFQPVSLSISVVTQNNSSCLSPGNFSTC